MEILKQETGPLVKICYPNNDVAVILIIIHVLDNQSGGSASSVAFKAKYSDFWRGCNLRPAEWLMKFKLTLTTCVSQRNQSILGPERDSYFMTCNCKCYIKFKIYELGVRKIE